MPAPPVEINFQVGGIAEVQKAFRSVDQAMARHERSQRQSAGRVATAKVNEEKKAAAGVIKEQQRAEREKEKIAAKAIREEEKNARFMARIAERATNAKIRSEERWAQRRIQIQMTSAKMAQRMAEKEARDIERARERLKRSIGGTVSTIGGGIRGAAGTAMALGAGALALGGGFTLANAVNSSLGAERAAVALSNSAFTGKGARVSKDVILNNASAVQAATNIDKKELIEGLSSYVAKSSDLAGGMANLGQFAELAKGSGTNFGDLMSAAGALRTQNENLKPEEMMNMLRNIVAQGKLGAVELKDLAGIAGKVTATSAAYSGSQTDAQRQLLGLSQIAIKTSGSPEEAATTVSRLASDTMSHQGKLRAAGITATDKSGLLKDPATILADVMQKTGGNLGKIGDLGYGERSIRLFEALAPTFQNAEAQKKGSGREAVLREVGRFTNAKYTEGDVKADFGEVMKTNAEKFEGAMLRLRETVEQKATPYLERFADKLPELLPKLEKLIDAAAKLADFFLANPFLGVGSVVAASIAKDIAGAQLGNLITNLLTRAFGPASALPGGAAAAGAGSGLMGKLATPLGSAGALGIAGAVGAGAIIGGAAGYGITNAITSAQTAESQANTASVIANMQGGRSAASIQAAIAEQQQQLMEAREGGGMGDKLMGGLAMLTGRGDEMAEAERVKQEALIRNIETLQMALADLTKAASQSAQAQNRANPNDPSRNVPQTHAARGGSAG